MKIALIIPAEISAAPYLNYYTDIFDQYASVEYFYITWKRSGSSNNLIDANHFQYNKTSSSNINLFIKFYHYMQYSNYVKRILDKEKFDLIIVFTIQEALFLSSYLLNKYKNKYIFDIRDYSPLYPIFKTRISSIIEYSIVTVISSIGFKQWLPSGYNYIIGHNVRKELITKAIDQIPQKITFKRTNKITILTIGQIRDFSTNFKLISSTKHNISFEHIIAGYGLTYDHLVRSSKDFGNVFSMNKYKKEEESLIVEKTDMINILLPNTIASNTLTSNRFYLSIIHRKPMIVNINNIHSQYVCQYKVGLMLRSDDNFPEKINEYKKNFEESEYSQGCYKLLKEIKNDILVFEIKIKSLLK